MSDAAVVFEGVYKSFPVYAAVTGGIKNFLFSLPGSLWNFRRNRFEALNDVSFTIRRGEAFAVMGRNGAGKSTILSLIAGVIEPTGGRVAVSGRVSPLLELGGGFHPDLSGRENIVLNGVLLGLSRREVKSRVDSIIDFSGIAAFIDQPLRTYSSGMAARLGFSVVAHLDPEILLIDEVLAVGDADFQLKCLKKLAEFRRAGVTMVLVSHNIADIESLCDRALWVDQHRVRQVGPTAEVIKSYVAHHGDQGRFTWATADPKDRFR